MSLDCAVDLLAELHEAGIELQLAGDRLRFRPKNALTARQRERLIENKASLLGLLELMGADCVVELNPGPIDTLGPSDFDHGRTRCHPPQPPRTEIECWSAEEGRGG